MQNNMQSAALRMSASFDDARTQELQGFDEFQALMAQPMGSSPSDGVTSLMRTVDNSRVRLDEALTATAASPTRANMVDTMRRLSELDLSATLAGKIADKATKGLDRILNLQ